MLQKQTLMLLAILLLTPTLLAQAKKTKAVQKETLESYVQRIQQQAPDLASKSTGSLWTDNGRFVGMFSDYKAARVGDLITIVVAQSLSAQNGGNVSTKRDFSASSGIGALAGHISTSGVQNIFSPTSTSALTGKSAAATTSSLTTKLAGRIVAVLPNDIMVVEAERQITMNNEKQTILLRGLVRPGDIAPDGSVSSNAIGNLELELKGKGVLSDGTRPPNFFMRMLLRLVGF